jgi:hypothetical protein
MFSDISTFDLLRLTQSFFKKRFCVGNYQTAHVVMKRLVTIVRYVATPRKTLSYCIYCFNPNN